jgi:oligoribonuclease
MPETEVQKTEAYAWFDAEFTSLDLDRAHLLQVAVILTDKDLQRLHPAGEEINLCIRLEEGAEAVSPWVAEHLPELVERCRSHEAVSVDEADRRIAALLDRYGGTPLHNDWFLLRRFLPQFGSRLHYRLLDVSTLKIQWADWAGQEPFDKDNIDLLNQYYPGGGIDTANAHDALFDIKASIAELAFYRSSLRTNG